MVFWVVIPWSQERIYVSEKHLATIYWVEYLEIKKPKDPMSASCLVLLIFCLAYSSTLRIEQYIPTRRRLFITHDSSPAPYAMGARSSIPGVSQPGRETNHSLTLTSVYYRRQNGWVVTHCFIHLEIFVYEFGENFPDYSYIEKYSLQDVF